MRQVDDSFQHFDVCVFCAMAEEAKAFMEVARALGASEFQPAFSSAYLRYYYTTVHNCRGEALSLQVSWQTSYGPLEAGLHMQRMLDEYKPGFAGMTGICAGDKKKVALGDLIVAEKAFFSDTGKFILDKSGHQQQEYDAETRFPKSAVLHFARGFDSWKSCVTSLERPISRHQQRDWLLKTLLEEATSSIQKIELQTLHDNAPDWRKIVQELKNGRGAYLASNGTLKDPARVSDLLYGAEIFPYTDPEIPRVHIAPMASGSAVRADHPFDDIRVPVRGTVAVDMEGASFYRIATDFPHMSALLVKGVADYADNEKDDSYHTYASAASAAYMLCLIKEYVTPAQQQRATTEITSAAPEKVTPPLSQNAPQATPPATEGSTPPLSQNETQASSEQARAEPSKGALNLFYASAPEDEALRHKLEIHLHILQRLGYIGELYGGYKVDVGADEEQETFRQLAQSKIIVLLLSPDFIASDQCNKQMNQAIKMQNAGKARVVPILLRSTHLEGSPVSKLSMLPRNKKAITSQGDRDTAFSEIAREIRAIIDELRKH